MTSVSSCGKWGLISSACCPVAFIPVASSRRLLLISLEKLYCFVRGVCLAFGLRRLDVLLGEQEGCEDGNRAECELFVPGSFGSLLKDQDRIGQQGGTRRQLRWRI